MKSVKITLLLFLLTELSVCWSARHRHRTRGAHLRFQSVTTQEIVRLKTKKLKALELAVDSKIAKESGQQTMSLKEKVSLKMKYLKSKTERELKEIEEKQLVMEEKKKRRASHLKSLFALRKMKMMNIDSNLESMRRGNTRHKRFGYSRKLMKRYLESRIQKRFTFSDLLSKEILLLLVFGEWGIHELLIENEIL